MGYNEDIHYGGVSIENFNTCSVEEMKSSLSKKGDKKFWRCTVCNDLYFGKIPPKECPTCLEIDAYIEINEKEFNNLVGLK